MPKAEELRQHSLKEELQKTEKEDIVAEGSLRLSNYKHKVFLGFLKVIPMIMAGLYLTNTISSYFDYEWEIISYLAGIGLIPWLFVMLASYIFRFCEYHRMFLWYILANNLICWIDSKWPLPISNWNYFILHIIIAGIFLFLILYFHQKCK